MIALLDQIDARIKELMKREGIAGFHRLQGEPHEDMAVINHEIASILLDQGNRDMIESWKDRAQDPRLKRRLEIFARAFLDARITNDPDLFAIMDPLQTTIIKFQMEIDGKPVSRMQSIQFKLADMATKVETARLLMYKTAWMKDNHIPFTKISAMCKLYASEVCNFNTYHAIGICGMDGLTDKYPAERYFRDMKLTEIGEGTSEIQRMVIAREALREMQAQMGT